MTTLTVAKEVKINNGMLSMFLNTLTDIDNHSEGNYDTTTRELAFAIIEKLGGEAIFLNLYEKIAKRGLIDVDCSFTRDGSVEFYFNNEKNVNWACAAIANISNPDFMINKIMNRIIGLKPGQLSVIFNEVPDKNGNVSKHCEDLCALMSDIC
ncbi:MAG: hypothetical protein J6N72_02620, partial [Psychrobacter sp.]|nr:hypothetical protein [Psychrobacter sp.]